MTWWLLCAAFAVYLVVRRVFRPRIVATVSDGLETAVITSVWSRAEYVRTSERDLDIRIDWYHVWRNVDDGSPASPRLCRRMDGALFAYNHVQDMYKRAARSS